MFDLSGKVALVTGATGGIGGAIAKSLHGQGATVVLSGTRAEALESLKNELGSRAHLAVQSRRMTASVESLPKSAEAAAGPIDILVNNAGITRDNLFMRMKDEEWDQVIAVNLTPAFRLSRAVIRGMMKKRWGRIVSITSIVGSTGNPGQAQLCGGEGRASRHDQVFGGRSGESQHNGQLRGAGLYCDPHDGRPERHAEIGLACEDSGRPYGHAAAMLPLPWSIWPATKRGT